MKDNISSDENMATRLLKDYIESWRREDFHNAVKKRDIERMYLFFKENCKKDCSSDIIDIGYSLADIYDKDLEFDKSLEITQKILLYFELSKTKEELALDKEYIRKVIGCAYGMAIAEVKSNALKFDLLNQSERLFEKAKKLCENYSDSIISRFCDKEFLWGLYHSDYGVFLMHRGDFFNRIQNNNEAKNAYNDALKEYRKSLEYRNKVLEATNDCDMRNETKNMIARNANSTGDTLSRLGRYEDGIKEYQYALNIFIELQDKEREILTKKNIIEGTIKLRENNHGDLHFEDFKICKNYLQDLRSSGVEVMEDIDNKMKEIEDSFHDESV